MGVYVEYRKLKDGGQTARLVIYDPISKKKITERIPVKILKRDPNRTEKLKIIEACRAQREHELLSGSFPLIRTDSNITMEEFFNMQIRGYQIQSVHIYEFMLKKAVTFFGSGKLLKQINQSDCQNFLDYLYKNLSVNSANVYYTKFGRVMREAEKLQYIRNNPANQVNKKGKTPPQIKNVLLIDEFRKLINTPFDKSDRGIREAVILGYYSGAGISDIKRMTGDQIRGQVLQYTRSKTGMSIQVRLQKAVIDQLPKLEKGKPIFRKLPHYKTINIILKAWATMAEIPKDVTFYSLRHSFAVNLLLAGVNIEKVRLLMGHTRIETTVKYLRFIESMEVREDELLPKFK